MNEITTNEIKNESNYKILKSKSDATVGSLPLSVSKCKTWTGCAKKFKLHYIEHVPQKEWSFHIFGKLLHEALERYFKEIKAKNTKPPHIIMTECFALACKTYEEKITLEDKKNAFKMLAGYLQLLSENEMVNKTFDVIGVEEPFNILIDDKILLNGYIDRIQMDPDGIIHVADYKTSKSDRYLKNDFFQLLTYAFFLCLQDPNLQKVRCSYIMLKLNFKSITKEFDREEIMKIADEFIKYSDQIQTEKLYRPNITILCNYCSYAESKDICAEGYSYTHPVVNGPIDW